MPFLFCFDKKSIQTNNKFVYNGAILNNNAAAFDIPQTAMFLKYFCRLDQTSFV